MQMENEFGVDHIYNADTFNEMVPRSRYELNSLLG